MRPGMEKFKLNRRRQRDIENYFKEIIILATLYGSREL